MKHEEGFASLSGLLFSYMKDSDLSEMFSSPGIFVQPRRNKGRGVRFVAHVWRGSGDIIAYRINPFYCPFL